MLKHKYKLFFGSLVLLVSFFSTSVFVAPSASAQTNTPTGANFQGDCKEDTVNASNCGIISYLLTAINALSALVGIVVVIMIVVGGIQYSASRDSPQMVSAARDRIRNAILGLIAYLFIYALLQYLVPGGIL